LFHVGRQTDRPTEMTKLTLPFATLRKNYKTTVDTVLQTYDFSHSLCSYHKTVNSAYTKIDGDS